MIDALAFARILALAGFLPVVVFTTLALNQRRPFCFWSIPKALRDRDAQCLRRAGEELLLIGVVVGIAPDILVLLDPGSEWLLVVDRILDLGTAPMLILGGMLLGGSSAANPKSMMAVWCAAIVLAAVAGFVLAAL